jgi:branched-chain amino acid aminotransferase
VTAIQPKVWVNGRVLDPDDALVPALDHGMTVGDGVFETMRTVDGVPFALERHLARLHRSASGLGLCLPERELLEQAVRDVVDASGGGSCRVRLTITAGAGPLGSGRIDGDCTIVAATAALEPVPEVTDVITVPWVRNERSPLVGLKTTSYADNVVALAKAHERGASEAILANTRDELCEGTGTNVFVVIGGRLLTPPLSSGCLGGITRDLVLECTDAIEETLPYDVLFRAEEIFVTSTIRQVQAVAHVDDHAVPAAPGPRTSAARSAFLVHAASA